MPLIQDLDPSFATTKTVTALAGKLLIAMPILTAPPFDHSVIYVCQHDQDCAMGLILNSPIKGLSLGQMLDELSIECTDEPYASQSIFHGGPVQDDRGFVLHSLDYFLDDITLPLNVDTLTHDDDTEILGLGLTASRDILVDMSKGKGPIKSRIALGYAGWGAGQLEDEIRQNAWLIAPSSLDLLFYSDESQLWNKAVQSLGVNPLSLSALSGQA